MHERSHGAQKAADAERRALEPAKTTDRIEREGGGIGSGPAGVSRKGVPEGVSRKGGPRRGVQDGGSRRGMHRAESRQHRL
eukprot:366449-Chlamydomonas_euryale.AAC.7